jgi:hypothetical protein
MQFEFREGVDPAVVSDFWYDWFDGGYVEPEKLLERTDQIDQVLGAIALLQRFRAELQDAGLLVIL